MSRNATGMRRAALVLTSSVTPTSKAMVSETVFVAGLDRVTVPTLIVANADDDCVVTPPSDAEAIRRALTRAPKAEVMMFAGGSPPRSEACLGLSPHGYLGIEARVVDGIAAWVKAQ